MGKKPKREEVRAAKETLRRWYAVARAKNKTAAMFETERLFHIPEYFEENTDFDIV